MNSICLKISFCTNAFDTSSLSLRGGRGKKGKEGHANTQHPFRPIIDAVYKCALNIRVGDKKKMC